MQSYLPGRSAIDMRSLAVSVELKSRPWERSSTRRQRYSSPSIGQATGWCRRTSRGRPSLTGIGDFEPTGGPPWCACGAPGPSEWGVCCHAAPAPWKLTLIGVRERPTCQYGGLISRLLTVVCLSF